MFAPRTIAALRVSCVALLAFVAGPLAARPAGAAYTAATTVNPSDVQTVKFTFNGQAETASAGSFQTILDDATGKAVSSPLTTYCVDVANELVARQSVNIASINALAGGYGAYVGSLYTNFAASATTAVDKAALQLAIWKTEYDGPGATSNTGHFVVTSASQDVINQAVYYYENNKLVANNVSYLQVVAGTAGQSLIGPAVAAVPEPASVALLGMGLVAAAGYAARRRRPVAG